MFKEYNQSLQQLLKPLNKDQRYKITIDNYPAVWEEWCNAEAAMILFTALAVMNTNIITNEDVVAIMLRDAASRFSPKDAFAQINRGLVWLRNNGYIELVGEYNDIKINPSIYDLVCMSDIIVEKLVSPLEVARIDNSNYFETIET